MVPSIPTTRPSRIGAVISPKSCCSDYVDITKQADVRWIRLPEAMFSSIMADEPELNPQYKISKALSDTWLKEYDNFHLSIVP